MWLDADVVDVVVVVADVERQPTYWCAEIDGCWADDLYDAESVLAVAFAVGSEALLVVQACADTCPNASDADAWSFGC